MTDLERVRKFFDAVGTMNEPIIRALLAEDPTLLLKRWRLDDCMLALFKPYLESNRPIPSKEIQNRMLKIMDVLFELGYKVTLNRFIRIHHGGFITIENLFYFFVQIFKFEGISDMHKKFLKKLLERMSKEELYYLHSLRFPITFVYKKENEFMDEVRKIISEILKERFQNMRHLWELFSNVNRGHLRTDAVAEGGAGAAASLPPRSKLEKTTGNIRNLIGSYLSGYEGTTTNQLSAIKRKMEDGGVSDSTAASAAMPGPGADQLISYFGGRRVSRKTRKRNSKTMRRRTRK